jgi:GTP-binding protein Era
MHKGAGLDFPALGVAMEKKRTLEMHKGAAPEFQKGYHASMAQEFKSGFIAIVGRPNAGKSTLVNRMVGEKVAIVTTRPQTTRNRIQGIVNRENAQVILIDTPGLHRPESALGRQMMGEVNAAMEAVDIVALILDASEEFGVGDRRAVERVARFEGKRFLLLNKIDRIPKAELLPLIETLAKTGKFDEIIPISALKGDGVDRLLEKFIQYLPAGAPQFPVDQYTDQPERFLVTEIVREKAMEATTQEVPHAVAVICDAFEETDKLIRIRATIYVDREGQKGILIGRGGSFLKKIGTSARKELETILGTKIFLELYVKVLKNWRENPQIVRQLDWHHQLEQMSNE